MDRAMKGEMEMDNERQRKGERMKFYQLTEQSDTTYSEEELHDIECKYCNTSLHYAMVNYSETENRRYFHEDEWGDYFCENEECVWSHIGEYDVIDPI